MDVYVYSEILKTKIYQDIMFHTPERFPFQDAQLLASVPIPLPRTIHPPIGGPRPQTGLVDLLPSLVSNEIHLLDDCQRLSLT